MEYIIRFDVLYDVKTDVQPVVHDCYHCNSSQPQEAIFLSTLPISLVYQRIPDAARFRLSSWAIEDRQSHITLGLTSISTRGCCPSCSRFSERIRSRYQRTLADLPWATFQVRLDRRVHKFFCPNQACHRRIFTERLPDIAKPWARRTLRLTQSLLAVGVALGGQAGSRLTKRLQRATPPASLLRVVHQTPLPPPPTLNVVGIDEWSWRRGRYFGTILVDLESHHVVDLLPDRSADTVAQWLEKHPSLTVVSRDRSALDANGITQGAPDAIQVVDRLHLVSNLREALEPFFLSHPSMLKAAAAQTAQAITKTVDAVPATERYRGRRRRSQAWQQRQSDRRQQLHEPRVATYEVVCRLHDEGATVTEIARQLELSRPTVYRHLRRATPPELKTRTARPSEKSLTPYLPYLIRRWRESSADSMQLWREIQAQGYRHSSRTVSRLITEWRRASEAGRPPEIDLSPYTRGQGPSARAVSFAVLSRPETHSRLAPLYLEPWCQV